MKYMGSKARFADRIYARINEITPRNGRTWVEPFAGGMNMTSHVPMVDGPRIATDSNRYLIAMFRMLRQTWIPPVNVDRSLYNHVKDHPDDYPAHLVGWIGFNCSYSGKWFGGLAGKVRTKLGTVRDYQKEAYSNVMQQIPQLAGVQMACCTYDRVIIPTDSIIYCDPPYAGTTQYKDSFDHDKFWNWVRERSRDHDVYVSEYNAPDDFECVLTMGAKSSLSANGIGGGSKNSSEKLFKQKGRSIE